MGIPTRAVFSLDGSRSEIHDRIRGLAGSFERVTSAIRLLVNEFGWGTHRGINTIVSAWNAADLENVVQLAASLGVRTMKIAPAYPGSVFSGARLGREQVLDLPDRSNEITNLGREAGLNMINLIPFAVVTTSRCHITRLLTVVDSLGTVYPCNPAKGGFKDNVGVSMGSFRSQSFQEIWTSERYGIFREGALSKSHPCCNSLHCGDATANAMSYMRGPCRDCEDIG